MKLIIFFSLFIYSFINQMQVQSQVLPSSSQVEWANAEIGVIIHCDINIFSPETFDYGRKETLPPLSVFNPSKLNTDQWLIAAKKAGANYAILTAKHGTGFCLWPTKVHPYHVGNTPFRNGTGDIVSDFINSCKKLGLKPGIYYNTNVNTYYEVGSKKLLDDEQIAYNEAVYIQLYELWSQYGDLFEIWFDGGVMSDHKIGIADKVSELLSKNQPNAILFQGPINSKNLIRWVGNEDGRAPYPHWSRNNATTSSLGILEIPDLNGKPNGNYWIPGEADFPNRKKNAWNGGWLWKAGEEEKIFTSDELVDRYYTSVGRNANMLIGMAIDTTGLFPMRDAQIFEEFGEKIKQRFANKLGKGVKMNNYYTISFRNKSQQINQLVIQEDIVHGECVRKYQVEALINGKWSTICEGTSIGHKRIHTFTEIETSTIRLQIIESKGEIRIKEFSVYHFNL